MGRIIHAVACSVAIFLFTVSTATAQEGATDRSFIRGDVNGDGTIDLSDAVSGLDYLFRNTGSLGCQDAADANDDGEIDISDPIRLMLYLFQGGAANQIPAPSQACGVDGSSDRLTCERYGPCETGGTVTVIEDQIGPAPDYPLVAMSPWSGHPSWTLGGLEGNVFLTATAVSSSVNGFLHKVEIMAVFRDVSTNNPATDEAVANQVFNVLVWTPEQSFPEFPDQPAAHYFFEDPTNDDYLVSQRELVRDSDGAIFKMFRLEFEIEKADIDYSELVENKKVRMSTGETYYISVMTPVGANLRILSSNGDSSLDDWGYAREWSQEIGPASLLGRATYPQIATRITVVDTP